MAWIKSDETLSQHPKVDELAEILDLHPAQVIGHLHYLWWWALSYADDGDLTKYKKRIATASNFDGDNDTYINALTTSGWLDQVGDQIHIHDWQEYHGALLDRREKDRERKRTTRIKKETDIVVAEKQSDTPEHREMFRVLAEVCSGKEYSQLQINEKTRGKLNVAVKQLRDMGANAQDIQTRGFNYFLRWSDRPTPDALVGNWTWLDNVITEKDKKKIKKEVNKAQDNKVLDEWVHSE